MSKHMHFCCCCQVTSVVSNSLQPHRRQPTRLSRPWDSPGKNTGEGCHFLLQMRESEKWKWSRSVVSHSLRPHGLQPARLLHPWDFSGKSTRVGCQCTSNTYKYMLSSGLHVKGFYNTVTPSRGLVTLAQSDCSKRTCWNWRIEAELRTFQYQQTIDK